MKSFHLKIYLFLKIFFFFNLGYGKPDLGNTQDSVVFKVKRKITLPFVSNEECDRNKTLEQKVTDTQVRQINQNISKTMVFKGFYNRFVLVEMKEKGE